MNNITIKLVDNYLKNFKEQQIFNHYLIEEEGLLYLFEKVCSGNKNRSYVLIKTELLNKFYGTYIKATNVMAENIYRLATEENLDEKLKKGETDIIEKIATISVRNGKKKISENRYFYSFATKYCNKYEPNLYPIYDSNVAYVLKKYRKQDKFFNFKNDDLKKYSEFKKIIDAFRNKYGLQKFSYKQLDRFLWCYGKFLQGKIPDLNY